MTNEQIIFQAAQDLAEQGIIAFTEETIELTDSDGKTKEFKLTEPIHTYQRWKEYGYQVKKGEKAIAKIQIWKPYAKKEEQEKTSETERVELSELFKQRRMFMKTAAFFSESQVQPIE